VTAAATASRLDSEVPSSAKHDLMSALQINSALCDGEADKGLIQAYIKWKAIMAAKEKSQELSWNGNRPTFGQIIDLFMSRSMFYSHFKFFDQAVKHPEMLEWLEETGACSDVDIWGKEKKFYNFVDLKEWLRKVEVDGESSSDGGRKKGKKVMKKKESEKEESSHKGEKKSHKGKGKAAESSNKRGSRK